MLTRLAQDRPKRFDNSGQQHQFQTLLKSDQLDNNVKRALVVIFCANKVDEVDEVENENIVDVRDYTGLDLCQHTSEEQNSELSSSSTKMAGSRIKNLLKKFLDIAYQNNKVLNSIIATKRAGL